MNIAYDKWIPVLLKNGNREIISLLSIFSKGDDVSDLAVQPYERVALMRLFLCIAHAALDGPKDIDDWNTVPERLPELTEQYLSKWKDFFELFHVENPWMQIAQISKRKDKPENESEKDWTPVSKLNFSLATGNMSTLFDHSGIDGTRQATLDQLIISMLTYQCFSPGGLISQVFWNGKQTSKTSKDSPCAPGSMYHAFLRGDNLLKTIWLNLICYSDIEANYLYPVGRPVWEKYPRSFDDKSAIENATETYLGRLMPLKRLIKLSKTGERMLLGDGLVYPTYTDGFSPEPSATVVERQRNKGTERAVLSYNPSKATWRELAAMVVKRKAETMGGPLFLLNIQEGEGFDLLVAALARDQATIVETSESVFHIPLKLSIQNGANTYASEISNAEKLASRLNWAVETWRNEMDGGWEGRVKSAGPAKYQLTSKLHSKATIHYWTNVESNLSLLFSHVEAMGTDQAIPTKETWRSMLAGAAKDAYTTACSRETPRQIRAFSMGWKRLMSIHGILDLKTTKLEESA